MPHVTAVGELNGSLGDITRVTKKLAHRTGPLETTLTRIEWAPNDYYRSFYALVNETKAFSKLYDDTCEIMAKCPTRPYHLSIMYTDKLRDSDKIALRDSIYAKRGGSGFMMKLQLTRLRICSTSDLPPEKWTCPIEIRLD